MIRGRTNIYNYIFLLFVIGGVIFVGCSRYKIRRDLASLSNICIHIPNDMEVVENGVMLQEYQYKQSLKPKLIFYYNNQGCNACKISHIYDLYKLFDMNDSESFDILIIVAPAVQQYEDVITQVKYQRHCFPIYIDKKNEFISMNSKLSNDSRYHTFLLDKNNRIILIGNPVYSTDMWNLFKTTLDNMLTHDGIFVPDEKN